MSGKPRHNLLPVPLLELQLSTIDLLLSMFCLPGEIEQSEFITTAIEDLRFYVEDPASTSRPHSQSIDFGLNVTVDPDHILELLIKIPLTAEGANLNDGDEPPLPLISLRCPSWMNRKMHADLVQKMPVDSPDSVMLVVEYLKEAASEFLATEAIAPEGRRGEVNHDEGELVRAWFYLQSLSTREKRNDMVNWAPGYGLTGFVLAGKPGILCLEGTSANISAYMSEIKTKSWSDVPSHQKKVSERYREQGLGVTRVFQSMTEVTDEISKGGFRGNRGDMTEIREMFAKVGLEDIFAEVVGL
ncbi:hypothetical protein SAICODRAFT_31841 [Saitoella complicata NRRL Y-17804]|uniref:Small nuclear ribonucleoprotein Prp3 C-terminal domain-containing protein n=1 Tax=Saitoella complicata (strain BCRC 22490 / CBS 7301 / JCM 7358 / NBRC 10748 / NRRL Y-17804) TaxID=698492 RepID=A0A0E9NKC4_SAICN|nr:uncharacterized protein SAICODRAFT_31841 [Saitoella complicata NRRL Y-17804]ODQ50554.1 hypothetical protein SAICODRAFT_31841 [Saitoella complicata NRRL Y-17804]GAO50332.1 hypothetical protein G7K_4461-t1 [Saitoella complicata NRRL Y-17804]